MKYLKYLIILIFGTIYFFLGYTNLYHLIGFRSLKSPYKSNTIVLENQTGEGVVKYLALGDSLTAGVGAKDIQNTIPYGFAENILKKENLKKVELINLSHPGDATYDLINRQLDTAIKENPDYITILIGINDIHAKKSAKEFQKNYEYILNELSTKTNADITVINLPYIGPYFVVWFPFNLLLDFRTKQFNDIIREISNQNRINYINLYDETNKYFRFNPKLYSEDLYHPSDEGYKFWNTIINNQLNK